MVRSVNLLEEKLLPCTICWWVVTKDDNWTLGGAGLKLVLYLSSVTEDNVCSQIHFRR